MFKYINIKLFNIFSNVVTVPVVIFHSINKSLNLYDRKNGYNSKLSDKDAMQNDWNMIGKDMWRSIMKYDEAITAKEERKR